jgi:O-Antigen ligase
MPQQHRRLPPASLRWLFVLALSGYPIAALLASWLNWDSTVASAPFRIGVVLLSLWVMARVHAGNPNREPLRWLFGFWLIYLVRLIWDWLIAGVPGAIEALFFFVVTVLIPCTVLALRAQALAERELTLLVAWVGAGICAAAVLMYSFDIGTERSLTDQTRRLSFEAINPITLGHVATSTLIAILCLTSRRLNAVTWAALLPAAFAAGACLILAASRGPMVALGLAAIAFAILTRRWRWLLLLALLLLPQLLDENRELWSRFATIEEDESALTRLLLQGNAIAQFLDHPVFGSAFVELQLLMYPHNLMIEAAMALGVVGLAVLLPLLYKSGAAAVRSARAGQVIVPLLFVQYFVGAQLSGAIYGNTALWATVALLIGLSHRPARARSSRPRVIVPPDTVQAMEPGT